MGRSFLFYPCLVILYISYLHFTLAQTSIRFPYRIALPTATLVFPQARPNFQLQPTSPNNSIPFSHSYSFEFSASLLSINQQDTAPINLFGFADPSMLWNVTTDFNDAFTNINFTSVNPPSYDIVGLEAGSVCISFYVYKQNTTLTLSDRYYSDRKHCDYQIPSNQLQIFVEYDGFPIFANTIRTIIKGILWFSILDTQSVSENFTVIGTTDYSVCTLAQDVWSVKNAFSTEQAGSQNLTNLELVLTAPLVDIGNGEDFGNLVVTATEEKVLEIAIDQTSFVPHGILFSILNQKGEILSSSSSNSDVQTVLVLLILVSLSVCFVLVLILNYADYSMQRNNENRIQALREREENNSI